MAWIESHQALARHWKVIRLATALGIGKPQAIGHLHLLWWWAADYADDGNLEKFTNPEITAAAEWAGDPDAFVKALQDACWLDGKKLHDWEEYFGKVLHGRRRNRDKQQRHRDRNRDITVTSPLRNRATVPYRTVPYQDPLSGSAPDGVGKESPGDVVETYHKDSRTVLHLLNECSGHSYREVDSNLKFISARLGEPGVDLPGVKKMILRQCSRWKGTKQAEYLRPETLFNKTKFDGYYAARNQPIHDDTNGGSSGQNRNFGFAELPSTGPTKVERVLARQRAEREAQSAGQPPAVPVASQVA